MIVKRLILKSDYKQMPWKNGLGVTAEIDRYPLAKDPFLWRLSQATISEGGPFSMFPGYDRLLTITDGHGIDLNEKRILPGKVMRFSGDTESLCRLINGPVIDLGLIYDREKIEAEMSFVSGKIELNRQATYFFYHLKSGDTFKVEKLGSIEVEPSIQVSLLSKI